jgi:hypothetical protein
LNQAGFRKGRGGEYKKWLPLQRGIGKKFASQEISHISTNKIRKENSFWIPMVEIAIKIFKKLVFALASLLLRKAMHK